MKASELRELTTAELETKLQSLKEELFNLRFQLAINQLECRQLFVRMSFQKRLTHEGKEETHCE